MGANGDYNTSRQLLNSSSWGGLIDVVQMNRCGWGISEPSTSPPTMQVNLTTLYSDNCQEALHILKEKDIDVHMWIGGASMDLVHNHDAFIASTIDLIQKFPYVKGIHFDDEEECAPRATLKNFTSWINFMNVFSEEMHTINVEVSVAVQAIFGIEDVPYVHNSPCAKAPWAYKTDPTLVDLISTMKVDRFLEMDTYYFSLARYLDALDWYVKHVPRDKLGIAVANLDVNKSLRNKPDEYLARMYALHKSEANWFNFFDLPIDEEWLEHARRWKTQCNGCPEMGCFEMDIPCNGNMDGDL